MPKTEESLTQKFYKNIKVEAPINNQSSDKLPFALYNPETEGKVSWMCNYDKDEKITSVFIFDDGQEKDKKVEYLESIEDAKRYRTELIDNGWLLMDTPKIEFSYADKNGIQTKKTSINRRDRRMLEKKLKKAQADNPFIQK